jgi:hypothetical protein
MKKMDSQALLNNLQADTRRIILATHNLLQQDPGMLLQQPAPGKWSVAQVIEHLNSYGRYYLPWLEKALQQPGHSTPVFTSGWLGNYFTNSMLPKNNGQVTNKMQSPKDHRPSPDVDSKKVLDEFIAQGQTLLQLLEKAKQANINRRCIPISIARFIKLKVGDTFRFVIAHHQRHFVQVANTLAAVTNQKEMLKGQVV